MNKTNVLHIFAGLDVGGGERHLLLLADGLNSNEYNILFACSKQQIFLKELKKRKIEALVVDMERRWNPLTFLRIRNFILNKKISIVHTHGARASFYGRIAAKWAGVPVILSTIHYSLYSYPINKLLKRIYISIDKLTSYFCDKLICVNNAIAEDLVNKTGINPNKVLTIYNGIDLDRFSQTGDCSYLFKEFNMDRGAERIGIIGRLSPEKGHNYFLKAVAELLSVFPKMICLVIGDGPLKEELIALSRKLGVSSNCIFTGIRHDIPQILSFLDILVLSSLSEGLPMILLEAMAARCPIVATKVGGIPELIEDRRTGLLVSPRDPLSLANTVRELLQNKDGTRKMTQQAFQVVARGFSAKRMANETEKVYHNLLKKQ